MIDLSLALHLAVGQLDALGRVLVPRLAAVNLWTLVLLAAALVLDRTLARRARASLRLALYAPVALRVLLPPDWSLGLAPAPAVDALLAPALHVGASPAESTGSADLLYAFVAAIDVAVVAWLAARAIVARVHLARALESARPVRALPSPVPCPVLEHDELGPMVVGLFSPRIVVPRRLLAPGEETALACVLRHEVAHVRRGDAWLSAATQLLAVCAWPVLPLWIAAARVRHLVELACDEEALDGADLAERRRYGHALLDMAEWRPLAVASDGALHFGSSLRARIEALALQRLWPAAVQRAVLFVAPLALFAACGGSAKTASTPAGHDREGYGYAFEKDPGGVASPMLPPGPDGRLPPETIQSTVRASFGRFTTCYESGLKKDPKLAGTVTVKFVFGEDGATREASDDGSTLADKEVVSCVVDAFRKISYPRASSGDTTVVYPVVFAP